MLNYLKHNKGHGHFPLHCQTLDSDFVTDTVSTCELFVNLINKGNYFTSLEFNILRY